LPYRSVVDVLDALIRDFGSPGQATHSGTISYDVQQVFNWLRKQPEAESTELARREYALLPLLRSYGGQQTVLSLHEILQKDATFFVDVLCDLYKAASDETQPEGEALEDAQLRAHAAMDLLDSWRAPPGLEGDVLDEDALNLWIDAARTRLAELDRAEIGDEQIGKILYHLPVDQSDHAWPHVALRKLLQRLRSDDIESGIAIEVLNSRGVTSRGMFEGGQQERALEEKWRQYAERMSARWSRSKALCLRIANDWGRQAEAEDLSARSRRVRQSR
jgi:hypothetical protein